MNPLQRTLYIVQHRCWNIWKREVLCGPRSRSWRQKTELGCVLLMGGWGEFAGYLKNLALVRQAKYIQQGSGQERGKKGEELNAKHKQRTFSLFTTWHRCSARGLPVFISDTSSRWASFQSVQTRMQSSDVIHLWNIALKISLCKIIEPRLLLRKCVRLSFFVY